MAKADKGVAEANLDDVREARDALADAVEALKGAMRHGQPSSRETFLFKLGFARGRLLRVTQRIASAGEKEGDA
jgi:hypothetical protein